jgi:TDG/mug DNA glycosylase family protein
MDDDDPTLAVYEQRADEWRDLRAPKVRDDVGRWVAAQRLPELLAVDLACGPGWYTPNLGPGVVAADAAGAMLAHVPEFDPGAFRVQADLRALPFRRGALGGALASKAYVHLVRSLVPLALADLHRSLAVGSPLELLVFGDADGVGAEHTSFAEDTFAGRRFSTWTPELLRDVVRGAGFEIETFEAEETRRGEPQFVVRARRARTLADTVGAGMRVLVCGLNPSLYAADAGVGFARPTNRFWPAAEAAGLVSGGPDPVRALVADRIGMTDLVKRATPRADELSTHEYQAGLERLTRLVGWLEPGAVCFVGLAGWRAAVDRRAEPGWQPEGFAGRPAYVMPSTSGANARTSLPELAGHLAAAAGGND